MRVFSAGDTMRIHMAAVSAANTYTTMPNRWFQIFALREGSQMYNITLQLLSALSDANRQRDGR